MRNVKALVFAAAALVASGAWAQGSSGQATAPPPSGSQQGQFGSQQSPFYGAQGQAGSQQQQGLSVLGVVSSTDPQNHTITVIAPETGTSIEQIGNTAVIDKEHGLVAIQAPVAQNTPIQRDGSFVSSSQVHQGDLVRANLDPNGKFDQLQVLSSNRVSQGIQQGQKDLSQSLGSGRGSSQSQQYQQKGNVGAPSE